MKLEEQIQCCFDRYPMLFQERWQVLNQLFCIIGNGYKWENGQLVSLDEEDKNHVIILPSDGKALPNSEYINQAINKEYEKLKKEFGKYYDLYCKIAPELAEKYSDEGLKKMAVEFVSVGPKEIDFYPLSEYSKLLTIPEDIQPDWLEGAKETLALVLQHGFGKDWKDENEWTKSQHVLYTEEIYKLAEKWNIKKEAI